MPQSAVVITVQVEKPTVNLNIGLNSGMFIPGLTGGVLCTRIGNPGVAPIFSAVPQLGMPLIFG